MIYFAGLLLSMGLLGSLSIYLFTIQFAGLSIITNLVVSVLAAYITSVFLKKYIKQFDVKFILLPFFLSFFVPVLGVIISFFIVLTVYKINRKVFEYTEVIYNPINLKKINYSPKHYGAGGAFLQLMKTDETPVKRIKALFFLAQGQVPNLNVLLQELLADNSDDIRLLSFNILDQQEERIQKDIAKILSTLQSTTIDEQTRAKLEKSLAQLYWELSYRHLVLKELQEDILKKSLSYALSALRILTNDAVILVLLGRLYSQLNQLTLAEEALKKASTLNIPPSLVLPYLAEIKFKMKDYGEVRYYLEKSETLLDVEQVAPVIRFWENK